MAVSFEAVRLSPTSRLEHRTRKWVPVSGESDAETKSWSGITDSIGAPSAIAGSFVSGPLRWVLLPLVTAGRSCDYGGAPTANRVTPPKRCGQGDPSCKRGTLARRVFSFAARNRQGKPAACAVAVTPAAGTMCGRGGGESHNRSPPSHSHRGPTLIVINVEKTSAALPLL